MDVGAGGLTRDGGPEGEKRDFVIGEISPQPDAFGLVGAESDIDPPAVIEAERAVHVGFAIGADRYRISEALFVGHLDLGEDFRVELPVAVEAFDRRMLARPSEGIRQGGKSLGIRFGSCHFVEFQNQFGAILRPLELVPRTFGLIGIRRHLGFGDDALGHKLLHLSFLRLLAVEPALCGGDHFVRLIDREFLAVEGLVEDRHVPGVFERVLRLVEAEARKDPGNHQALDVFEVRLSPDNNAIVRIYSDLRRVAKGSQSRQQNAYADEVHLHDFSFIVR